MRIGELADATGVSTRSLRYYEEQGLIRSDRTAGGWREFDPSMVERVVMIQHLLACLEAPPAERTGVLEVRLAEGVGRLEAKRCEIDRELEVLQALRQAVRIPQRADALRAE